MQADISLRYETNTNVIGWIRIHAGVHLVSIATIQLVIGLGNVLSKTQTYIG